MKLTPKDRAALARRLLASVEPPADAPQPKQGSPSTPPAAALALRYTFKVDASYHLQRQVTGIGIAIHARDASDPPSKPGTLIERIAELYAGVPASACEQFAILRALELARQRGYVKVSIRSDYNDLRKRLKEDHAVGRGHARIGLDGVILRYARQFAEIHFPYHPRRKNQEAHRLARYAVSDLAPKPCPEMFVTSSGENGSSSVQGS